MELRDLDINFIGFVGFTSPGLAPLNDYDSFLYHLSQPQYELEVGRLGIPWDRNVQECSFPS